ncbi:MAG TPA: GPR endopeptidase [Spirochaetia bacterium]|nr:GPR endopeptidase [Spirochaetia bacterium]
MQPSFLSSFNVNLDLALEARDLVRAQTGQEIPGVTVDREDYPEASVTVVRILEPSAAEIMKKPVGTYITIEAPGIRYPNREVHRDMAQLLSLKLGSLFHLPDHANVLLVGLGNWNATPDALGPKVINMSLVTRHLYRLTPQEIRSGMRSVSALAPGVLGITGIETVEIVQGVVEKVKPELIIAIDALAARNVERIGTTIQLADTGINPGSGIGNQRAGLNRETLGVPVVAVGIPTVVNAAVIASDAIDRLMDEFKSSPELYRVFRSLPPDFTNKLVGEVLKPFGGEMTVTPKEIDSLIKNAAMVVAGGISLALHPSIDPGEFGLYLQ